MSKWAKSCYPPLVLLTGALASIATIMLVKLTPQLMAQEAPTTAPTSRPGQAPQARLFDPEDPAVAAKLKALGKRGIGVHDPSTIVKCKDEYWLFYTGGGTPSYRSKDLITWERGPQVHSATPSWVATVVPPRQGRRGGGGGGGGRGGGGGGEIASTNPTTSPFQTSAITVPQEGGTGGVAGGNPTTNPGGGGGGRRGGGGVFGFWAPDVIFVDGEYHLFYSASAFGRNTSGIGLITNPTLDPNDPNFKWTDQGLVVQSKTEDNYNAIDPAMLLDQEGRLWMAFGSFWSGIQLIELDPKTGKRMAGSPMHTIAYKPQIEATFIYHHDGYYYQFVSWGWCCRGSNSTYNIRVGRSKTVPGPYLDKEGVDMAKGGGSPVALTDGPFIGPGHPGIIKLDDGKELMSMHYYDGTTPRGASMLAIREVKWDAEGWPVLQDWK